MMTQYPCIIVERPHQRAARAWIAYSARDILLAAEYREGDWLSAHEDEYASPMEAAIAALGHDLYSLDILQCHDDAVALLRERHNVPRAAVAECERLLGWVRPE